MIKRILYTMINCRITNLIDIKMSFSFLYDIYINCHPKFQKNVL